MFTVGGVVFTVGEDLIVKKISPNFPCFQIYCGIGFADNK